jgi:hypothetical protein
MNDVPEQQGLFALSNDVPNQIRVSDQPGANFVLVTSTNREGYHVAGRRFGAFYAHAQVGDGKYWQVSFWNGSWVAILSEGLGTAYVTKKKACEIAADLNATIPMSFAQRITRSSIGPQGMTSDEAHMKNLLREVLLRHIAPVRSFIGKAAGL